MYKSKVYFYLIVSILLFYCNVIYSLPTYVDFLKLSIGARATGMGESYTGLSDDGTAVYWNPGGIGYISKKEFDLMHTEIISDATLTFIGFSYPIKNYGTFSISTIFYIIKPIPVTGLNNESLGELNWTDRSFIISYGKMISKNFTAGLSLKYILRTEQDPIFGKTEGSTNGIDIGCIYNTPLEGLRVGVAFLNNGPGLRMSNETKVDSLPQTTRIGLAYLYPLKDKNQVIFTSDINKIVGGNWGYGTGMEFSFKNTAMIRCGYYKKEGNIEGLTYGLGIRIKNLDIDYSNIPVSQMVGFTRDNKFSIIIRF